ncbi:hypothetical protein MetfoDRAFT_0865 [Methanotorris formicicus Mc-S-70]|uniref:Nucleoside recognition domain protein n=1 Tax=Methanotorris formicicus Mc-S-70 TaxID=647171 RepID=H1KYJ2_9EURY|nr:hypothetical protein [Methanotorris formicicus]EHP87032.1 hypothetical protein MetfoDRAFT_0865 [Methanotorris formicicus Mc-S-70]
MDFLNLYLVSIASITFGYVLAEILNQTNLIKLIGKKTSKIAKIGIHPSLSTVPALYLVSPRLAHTTASSLLKKGEIDEFDLYIAILASNFSLRIMYIYRYYLPVLLPLLGIVALYFIGLRIIFDIFLLFVVMLIGKRRYKHANQNNDLNNELNIKFSKEVLKGGFINGLKLSLKFIKVFTPIFLVVVFMMKFGIMDKITKVLSPILKFIGLDSLGITYVSTAVLSPRVAYGIAKIMLDYHYSINIVLGCMFIGNGLFVLTYEWWVRILPYYAGLYPKDVALKLVGIQAFLPSMYSIFLGILLLKLSF